MGKLDFHWWTVRIGTLSKFDLKQRHRQSEAYRRCYVNETALDDRLRLTFASSYTVREWEKLNRP
ncbi:hypothetical protein T07_7219 [Trichinella nelsoni]|uniref:Uncharacterized protein n=1 Tax=Trichinella nelsoni TaxID=6336 RepID=A0A0V0S9G6_9BILA|nr:hypothetical protein T07_7219 [Trichinella nelsoni]